MLASKAISVYSVDEGQANRREEVAWICVNKDCEENKTGRFVEPAWVEVVQKT
jgi:hypothetical protein